MRSSLRWTFTAKKGRNGFGLADMCGGLWEFVLDHFDPQGAHEEAYFVEKDPHPVCRGGNYFDVPGQILHLLANQLHGSRSQPAGLRRG